MKIHIDPIDGELSVSKEIVHGVAKVTLTWSEVGPEDPDMDIWVGEAPRRDEEYGRNRRSDGKDLLVVLRKALRWAEENGVSLINAGAANEELHVKYERMIRRYRGEIKIYLYNVEDV
jgi:hypothetical protein